MPRLTLAERCVRLCHSEMASDVRANPYGMPNTGPRVREYLAGCMRDVDRDGDLDPLGLTAGNWCMALQSWVLFNSLQPDDDPPHHWRAGVVEAVSDAKKRGLWLDVEAVRAGEFVPKRGDLAIWDRSNPDKPSTSWWRHVNRITEWDEADPIVLADDYFRTIGGNEGRRIRLTGERPKLLESGKLLGFIRYDLADPEVESPPRELLSPVESRRLQSQIAMGIDEMRRDALASLDRSG